MSYLFIMKLIVPQVQRRREDAEKMARLSLSLTLRPERES